MTTLYYNKLTPQAFAATTAQAGYPASNAGLESIDRPWLSTTLGANDFTVSFAALTFVDTAFIHDANFLICTVERSADGVNFANVGVLTTHADEHGRRRGKIAVGGATLKALRYRVAAAGASDDGAAWWRIGAQYLFGSSLVVATGPSYNYRVSTRRPRVSAELPNFQVAQASTGPNIDRIEVPYDRKNGQSLRDVKVKAEQGTVLLSLDLADWPHQVWPVRSQDEEISEAFYKVHKAQGSFILTEVV